MNWRVSVCCRTFNQSKYIVETMNGFVVQQTTFPFVCTIVDDASTDGEQEVILHYLEQNFDCTDNGESYSKEEEYGRVVLARHKKNRNCYFAVVLLNENHYSIDKPILDYIKKWRDGVDYIAFCEGDDYWIHPRKLQCQVDFLDTHSDYVLVRTNVDQYIQEEKKMVLSWFSQGNGLKILDTIDDYILNGWFAAPCTWMYRRDDSRYNKSVYNEPSCFKGDIALLLTLLKEGKVKYFPESMAVYRVLSTSASHFKSQQKAFAFWLSVKNTRWFFRFHLSLIDRIKLWYKDTRIMVSYIRPVLSWAYIQLFVKTALSDFVRVFSKG